MLSFPTAAIRVVLVLLILSSNSSHANEILGRGHLGFVTALAVGNDGRVYISNLYVDDDIAILNADGSFHKTFSAPGDEGLVRRPIALDVDSAGQVFLADAENDEILIFDAEGNYRSRFLPRPSDTPLTAITDLTIGPEGNIYIADARKLRVFDPTGSEQQTIEFTQQGEFGEFFEFSIRRVTVRENGDLYLLGNSLGSPQKVQFWGNDGQSQFDFGFPSTYPGPRGPVSARINNLHVDESGLFAASEIGIYKYDLSGTLQYTSIGHHVAQDIATYDSHLLIGEARGRFVRRITDDQIQNWSGRTMTRREQGPFFSFDRLLSAPQHEHIWGPITNALETSAEVFQVPGNEGDEITLNFSFHASYSGMNNAFGVYEVDQIESDRNDYVAFAQEVLQKGTVLFDTREVLLFSTPEQPNLTSTEYAATSGSRLGFFLLPGVNSLGLGSIEDLELASLPRQPVISRRELAPVFSEALANLGQIDQMLAFLATDETYFAFEDLKIATGAVDYGDFTDMVVSVNTRLIPVPEPTCLMLLFFSLLIFGQAGLRSAC